VTLTTTLKHFDAITIGTGQAGPPLAARFAGSGKSVAIQEMLAGAPHKPGKIVLEIGHLQQ